MRSTPAFPAWPRGASGSCCTRRPGGIRCFASPTRRRSLFADNQLLIQKNVRKDRTFTEIHTLDMDGRVEVLARMISGDKVSELSLASARELIEKSK